jgi:hypothetical protein
MFIFWRTFAMSAFRARTVDAIDMDGPAARLLEQVQAAQEGALAGARRADDGNHLALVDLGGDVLEHERSP